MRLKFIIDYTMGELEIRRLLKFTQAINFHPFKHPIKVNKMVTRGVLFKPKSKKIVFLGDSTKENMTVLRKEVPSRTSSSVVSQRNKLARPNLGPTKIPLLKTSENKPDYPNSSGIEAIINQYKDIPKSLLPRPEKVVSIWGTI